MRKQTPGKHGIRDAYHTLEAHNAREIKEDTRGILSRSKDWLSNHIQRFKNWFLTQPLGLKILYGLTLVPVIGLLLALGVLLVKFGGPILFFLLISLKFLIAGTKLLFFISYVSYKILKTLLIWYYMISRTVSGNKATKARKQALLEKTIPITGVDDGYNIYTFEHQRKMLIVWKESTEYQILFSYLRYAINGQVRLLAHFKNDAKHYLTMWREPDLAIIKKAWADFAQTIFKPHLVGAQLHQGKLLVLGDAQIDQIEVNKDKTLQLTLTIRWIDWTFKLKKARWFLEVHRNHQSEQWQVNLPIYPKPVN